MDETWLRYGASLGIGLLIGLERERNPAARAGVRTFALVALAGTLAAALGGWLVPVGFAAVAAMLIAAYAIREPGEDAGTTTVIAALVCYLLGALAGTGETTLAAALGIGVTALLYFKPELEGLAGLERRDQVSVLQFLVVTFVVLPILPDQGYGPYEALNPRHIWLMVALIAGVGLASYAALRAAGERHGVLLTGILGGLVSSTATTVLYARRSADSEAMARVAFPVVALANLIPLARVAVIAAVLAPSLLPSLVPVLGAALGAGLVLTALAMRRPQAGGSLPVPEIHNPVELGIALRFAALYAIVLLASAWLADIAGDKGLYAVALASGLVDVDPVVLSALNFFGSGAVQADTAVLAVALALLANAAFKLSVLAWFNPRLALRIAAPTAAAISGAVLALALG